MVWMLSKHDEATIAEIEKQSDRAGAILAAACLEDRLSELLRTALEPIDDVANQVFKGYGPLSSFKSKIDIAYLMGMFPADTWKTLNRIKDIRNEFAHNTSVRDFTNQRISDLCSNFQAMSRKPKGLDAKGYKKAITRDKIESVIKDGKDIRYAINLFIISAAIGTDSPRKRYMLAVKQLMFSFSLLIQIIVLRRDNIRLKQSLKELKITETYWPWPSHDKPSPQLPQAPQNGSRNHKTLPPPP